MIRKITCIFMAVVLVMGFQFAIASANTEVQPQASNADMTNTAEIMKAIGIDDAVSGNGQYLTRAEFLYNIVRLIGYKPSVVSESSFSDVPAGSFYAGAVKYALDTNIISLSESFYPNNPIRYTEACKIAVSALGFDYYAVANGGFPSGYIRAAQVSDLLIGVGNGETLTAYDALTMIDNFMNANVYAASGFSDVDGGTAVIDKSETVLKYYHDVEILEEKIITSTVFSGLYEAGSACDESQIEIDNKIYKYSGSSVNMLGKCADVYCRKDGVTNTVLYLDLKPSSTVTTKGTSIIRAANQTVEYEDGVRSKTIKLVLSPTFIYNNCADPTLTLDSLTDSDAEISFTDNDLNGVYDVVYINECSVSVAETVNVFDEFIVCSDKTVVDLRDENCVYYIEKNGIECELSEIAAGDVLLVYRSHLPANVITVYVSKESKISGTVTGLDISGRTIYIDDVAYAYTKDFERNNLSQCGIGTKITVLFDSIGQIAACYNTESKAEYGYYINIRKETGLLESVQVKMLDANGKIEIYTIDETIIFDGGKITRAEAYNKLNGDGEQIIRYTATADKILKMIDTQNATGIVDENAPENDRLSLFEFPVSSPYINSNVAYIAGSMMFHPHFQVNASTKVFKIINDDKLDDNQRYTLITTSYFSSIKFIPRTDFNAYDVIETGQTGAVVYNAEAGGTDVNQESNSGIIYSANLALSPDGEQTIALVVYKSGQYQRFYIEDEAVLLSVSNDASFENIPFKKGDYIKYNSGSRNVITGITKDFDYQAKTVLNVFQQHMLYGYYYGRIYDSKDGMISVMPENIGNVEEALTDGAYRYRFKLPASLTVYDSKTGTIYQGTHSDIVTYLQSETECHKILLRMYEGTIRDAVLYK